MADLDDKCDYCGVSARVARSRLHDLDHNLDTQHSLITYHEDGAAKSCEICGLIVESFRSWEGLIGYSSSGTYTMLSIKPAPEGCTVEIFFSWSNSETSASLTLDVFSMVGVKKDWRIRQLQKSSPGPLSSQAVATVKSWLSACEQNHHCHEIVSKSVPKRLLELSDCQLRLKEDVDSTPRYACLSHCWGKDGPALRLTSGSHQLLTLGVTTDRLPKTFADAVTLCLSLGIGYIWIDALCIFQDRPKDWQDAAASMADIYEGASITIAATSSGSSDQGFPSTYQGAARPVGDTGVFVLERRSFPDRELKMDIRCVTHFNSHDLMSPWPLLTRAWVYQERRLSACVVHIGERKLYWECRESFRSEDGTEDILNPDYAALTVKHEPHEAWRKDVEQYSRLSLTFEKDRLPAISAVVERMQSTRPADTYIAGLWVKMLLHDLAWTINGFLLPRPDSDLPTWSWMAIKTGVMYIQSEPLPSIRLLNVEYEITGPEHIGRTLYARIDLVGKAFSVEWSSQYRRKYVVVQSDTSYLRESFYQIDCPDFEYSTARPPIKDGETLDCLFLSREGVPDEKYCTYGALVLRRTKFRWFERVGMVFFTYRELGLEENSKDNKSGEEAIDSLPERHFTIV